MKRVVQIPIVIQGGTGSQAGGGGSWGGITGTITDQTDLVEYVSEQVAGAAPVETDPIFTGSDAYNVTAELMGQWDDAYGWGDHAQAGYVTGTPWTSEGYVTGTPWTSEGYQTASDVTTAITSYGYCTLSDVAGVGYVTGTPWTSEGYLTDTSAAIAGYLKAADVEAYGYLTDTSAATAGYLKAADVAAYGYQTASDVTTAITSCGYCTLSDVAGVGYVTGTPWTSEGYLTDTSAAIAGYLKAADVEAYGYQDATAVGGAISTALADYTTTSGLGDAIAAWMDANGVVP